MTWPVAKSVRLDSGTRGKELTAFLRRGTALGHRMTSAYVTHLSSTSTQFNIDSASALSTALLESVCRSITQGLTSSCRVDLNRVSAFSVD